MQLQKVEYMSIVKRNMILDLIIKIYHLRNKNINKIWLVHLPVIAVVFLFSYLENMDFTFVPRIISVLYLCITMYLIKVIIGTKDRHDDKYFFLIWAFCIQSLVFLAIDLEEKGMTCFMVIMILNVLFCLYYIYNLDC